ncbi:MAG: Ppx/GppA family phosphatase, partial [Actinomycetota bacterium]|nr:Ppx/GppA family phosphatase [Actinomycetota bacterium]
AEELAALAADARAVNEAAAPEEVRARVRHAMAVAGTATSSAAIDLALEPYDPARTEGHRMAVPRLQQLLARLAALPLREREGVVGLDPARAPTIVAGVAILLEVLRAFGLDSVEVSERDILWGVALEAASA